MVGKIIQDRLLLVLVVLLIATITVFVSGYTPYPFGIIILGVLLVARVIHLRNKSG